MKKMFVLAATMGVLLSILNFSFAQEEEGIERILVLREAKQHKKTTVAVEAYLVGDVLEVTTMARMQMRTTKLRIYNILVVGPKLGRICPKTREILTATAEEEAPFSTTKLGGLIRYSEKTKEKKAKGTLTKELAKFKIPADKIIPGKRYQLWVDVQSVQKKGRPVRFKFDLENLAQLISQ